MIKSSFSFICLVRLFSPATVMNSRLPESVRQAARSGKHRGLTIVMLFYHPHRWQAWIGVVFWIAAAAVLIDSVSPLLGLRK